MDHDRPDPLPPSLSPAVEALLAFERDIPERSEMVRARMAARARDSVRGSNAAALGPSSWGARPLRVLLAAAAGVALMVSAAAAFQMVAKAVSPRKAAEPGRVPVHVARVTPEHPSVPAPAAEDAPVMPPSPRLPSVVRKEEIAELHLLRRARRADARGDYLSVLAIAEDHEKSHPSGRLAEEREVLRLKALVALGRSVDARHAAARFHRQFPRSVLLKRVDDMLLSLP